MKKLMMAVAIVCAAVGVQASCVDWTVYADGSDLASSLYAVNASDLAGKTLSALAAEDVIGNALTWINPGDQSPNAASPMKDVYGYALNAYTTVNDANLENSVYLILVKDNTYSIMNNGAAFDITENVYPEGLQAKPPVMAMEMSPHTYTEFQGVPEPTSGLLLLLGVAGLALRRRRA